MGFAVGCVGMSLQDFELCTPSEFFEVAEQWRKLREEESKEGWEKARFLAAAMLQPYSRKQLNPEDVAKFPWDEKKIRTGKPSTRQRMMEMKRRAGKG